MSKEFLKQFAEQLKLSLKKTKVNYDLPSDYIVSKFYEFGYKVFHDTYNNTYRCCCPICREGKSWGSSQRCYYLPERNQIYCHNCGFGWSPFDWIREVSGMTDQEIQNDVDINQFGVIDVLNFESVEEQPDKPSLPEDSINLFDETQVNYYQGNKMVMDALKYIKGRRLNTAINKPDAYYISLKDYTHKNRLVIPFKDTSGKIVWYQSRKLLESDDKASYISKSGYDKTLFGMDKIDSDCSDVFMFEGPLDSTFVKNGLGLAGINKGNQLMTSVQEEQFLELALYNKIWILDSQWIDKTSQEKTQKLIDMGEKVFLWPRSFGMRYKDFNSMCVDKKIDSVSHPFIKKNSFRGKEAILKYKLMLSRM